MIDYNLFKEILSSKENGYIDYGDFIDNKTFILLSNSQSSKVIKLFKTHKLYQRGLYFTVEVKCQYCGHLFEEKCSKTRLFDLFKYEKKPSQKNIICDKCKTKKEQEDKKISDNSRVSFALTIRENTDFYIDRYLDPKKYWKKGVNNYSKMKELGLIVDKGMIYDYINDMEYHDFLETPYWKAISEKVKIKANYRCQLCNSNIGLNTHHRCYDNHGDELHHMEDLICICEECHNNHHNK